MTDTQYKLYIDEIIRRVEEARLKVDAHHIVKIVAVSKYVDEEAVKRLYKMGQRAFGENRVQDLRQKASALEDLPLEWHFIGTLQKNKINNLLDIDPFLFQSLHSVDLAHELQKKLSRREMQLDALIQINSAKERSKHGFMPEVAQEAYMQIKEECPNINLKGVMSIGAHTDDKAVIEESFKTTYKIYQTLPDATICSMGMSGDFELAIACGSNMVRLGSILFPEK